VEEHLHDNDGELLLHLLTADLRRLAIAWLAEGHVERMQRLLTCVETGLLHGDEAVRNAMAVSFVEDTGWWLPEMRAFIGAWPAGLARELNRQRSGR